MTTMGIKNVQVSQNNVFRYKHSALSVKKN